jgi:uncharacterized lipoprotein YddW (UPF0748 family)
LATIKTWKPEKSAVRSADSLVREISNARLPRTDKVLRVPLTVLWLLANVLCANGATYEPSNITPPWPMREYRAAWVATVGNIDWPSQKGLRTSEQKAELLAILDRAAQLRLNVVIFQVRPACDALYASQLEPWSEYLTGRMGEAPAPFYDPLAFAIEEAHKRGLELHAWFNPYRAGHPSAKSAVAPNHITRTHPELVRHYGTQVWLDPGEKAVQEYSLSVVMDVVRRYDLDGVHFDDYFYPYKETNSAGIEMEFPDESSFRRYAAAGGKLNRDDWRRENVNVLIERTYRSIKAAKPWVKFGVSPFGIWRPGYPAQIKGFDAYEKIYADSRKWLVNGWVDYLAPQLYWSIASREQSFPALLSWWAAQNSRHRHLMPGLDATKTVPSRRTERPATWKADEILSQIRIIRKQKDADGEVFWNIGSLQRNDGLAGILQNDVYAEPALAPASPWLGNAGLGKPRLSVSGGDSGERTQATWTTSVGGQPWLWLLQTGSGGKWKTEILPRDKLTGSCLAQAELVAISPVDRYGNVGPAAVAVRHEAGAKPATPKAQSSGSSSKSSGLIKR